MCAVAELSYPAFADVALFLCVEGIDYKACTGQRGHMFSALTRVYVYRYKKLFIIHLFSFQSAIFCLGFLYTLNIICGSFLFIPLFFSKAILFL